MIRQLTPATHIDTSPKVLRYLAPHIARVVYVDASGRTLDGDGNPNVSILSATSLLEYAAQFAPLASAS